MDAQQSPTSHPSIQVLPPLSPPRQRYDYLPKRSTPSSPLGTNVSYPPQPQAQLPPVRHSPASPDLSRPLPFGATASPTSYVNGTQAGVPRAFYSASSPNTDSGRTTPPEIVVVPRKRAQVEDILNPVHQEVIIPKNNQQENKPRPTKPTPSTPAPKQVVQPSSGSAITISSSTVSSSKSTPTSAVPVQPVKQPKSIRLHVPLNGSSNVYINFASLAEKTYGSEIFNSKRLLGPQGFASSFLNHDRILDTGSDSEAEDDDASEKGDDVSAVETDGAAGKKKPVKRRRRQAGADKYDVEDPFIDDSEALMEQVAAASKDGFFVYSGPLIAEGERAKIDKYIPNISKMLTVRADVPKKRKAPAKKPPGEKVPRAKKTKEKEKDKGKVAEEIIVEEVPQVIAQ